MSVHIFLEARLDGVRHCRICLRPEEDQCHLKPMPPADISVDGDESIRRKKEQLLNEFRELS
jgi:hypothetical protein